MDHALPPAERDVLEREIGSTVPGAAVITHLEPEGDSTSFDDIRLERTEL